MKQTVSLATFAFCAAASAAALRIMPLGDSITYGQGWDPHGG